MKRLILPLMLLALALPGCRDDDNARHPSPDGAGSVTFDEQQAIRELEELQTRLQRVLDRGGEASDVLRDTRRYVEKYPNVAAGLVLLGNVELLAGNDTRAAEQFERALAIDPRQAEVRLLAGTAALRAGDLDRAERNYTQAVSLDTGNATYRVHLASVYLRRGELDKARQALLEAIRLDSEAHRAYAMLGDVFARENKPAMAIDQLDRALERVGDDKAHRYDYLRTKAKLQLRQNRPTDALRTLSELPPQMQVTLGVSRELAACWAMLGDPGRAATHFEQVVTLDPVNEPIIVEAIQWMIKAERYDDARRMLNHLRKTNPRHESLAELERQLATDAGPNAG